MKRRSFIKTSAVTTLAAGIIPATTKAAAILPKGGREFYELRTYTLKNAQQQALVESYFKAAAIPPSTGSVTGTSAFLRNLRRYEHATESAGKKKLEMFNDAGETAIFKRLGFNPVFSGETLIGEARPNLIYLLAFDDLESHDRHWKAFGADPEWKKISALPEYADAKLVSHITSTYLIPSACSQI
jgi:hypothetical protein